jgi:hypothetical protein
MAAIVVLPAIVMMAAIVVMVAIVVVPANRTNAHESGHLWSSIRA